MSAAFKNSANRVLYNMDKSVKPPVGAYKVDYYNIERGARIDEEEDPDLAVKKPGFASSDARFKYHE